MEELPPSFYCFVHCHNLLIRVSGDDDPRYTDVLSQEGTRSRKFSLLGVNVGCPTGYWLVFGLDTV